MSQITGSFTIDTDRVSRELAYAVVAQLDQRDLVGALADAVTRRVTAALAAEREQPAGEGSADPDRPADTGPQGTGRPWSGAQFGPGEDEEESS